MEENKSHKKKVNFDLILSFIAYIGIGCIAIALLLTLIFQGDTKLANIFSKIGQVLGYSLSIVLAYNWVKTHKHIAWIVCYVVFVVTIIVLFFLTI